MGSDDGLQVLGRQRWENVLRAENGQSMHQWPHSGRKVWFKQIREQKERKDKIVSEWHEGLWLGQSRSINETIVGFAQPLRSLVALLRHCVVLELHVGVGSNFQCSRVCASGGS